MTQVQDEAQRFRDELECDDQIVVSVALFGQPGAGKSSLINRLTGQRLAPEGVRNDVTVEAKEYHWNGLTLVDLPGFDTAKFPAETYLERFNVLNYDIILCVFDGKFHEADQDLFDALHHHGKAYLFVRNKHDDLWQEGKTTAELEDEIRENVRSHFKGQAGLVFTSCRNNFGMDGLERAILDLLPLSKQERWIRSVQAYTREFLERKRAICAGRIWKSSAAAAANALNPIPGVDVAVDITIVLELFVFIRATFGLDRPLTKELTIPGLAPLANNVLKFASKEGIMLLLKRYATAEVTKEAAKWVPVVGQAIAALAGFGILTLAGNSYLDDCEKLAEQILVSTLRR